TFAKATASASKPAFRTFFGERVWSVPILRVYFPFFLSGTTSFFLFSYVHVLFSNDANDQWNKIVDNGNYSTAVQKLKNEASAYYEAELAKGNKL
ncbi:hypothetical protein HDU92_008441, partial [Lobulomyces angularis]